MIECYMCQVAVMRSNTIKVKSAHNKPGELTDVLICFSCYEKNVKVTYVRKEVPHVDQR